MMEIDDLNLLAHLHLAVTAYMTGLIWFVQVVHYPLFGAVGRDEFARYERRNTRITLWVVGPPMLAELGLALALVVLAPGALTGCGLAALGMVWASTWLLQVPAHRRLEQGFDHAIHARLVRTNWIRTTAWTARVLIAVLVVGAVSG